MIIGFSTHIMPKMAACLSFFAVQHPTIWDFAKGSATMTTIETLAFRESSLENLHFKPESVSR
jgi:hypothetical protein